ncbi:aminoglycoside phosphotransferase [Streptomyces sp. NPDC098789]|uniref:aminoglycoside phosphotransferase n=1 Tax=Streptomyces sp. NPDC098789 TaxID=3366098 RepID=UPI00382CD334
MPADRVGKHPYAMLPEGVRQAIDDRVGADCPRTDIDVGTASALSTLFFPSGAEKVFVKGLPLDHERVDELKAEEAVNPFLPDCAPKLLWRAEAAGWLILGFYGTTATPWAWYASQSQHLEPIATVLRELSAYPAPDIGLPTAWDRWSDYCDPADEPLLRGDRLVHSDPAASNFMMEPSGRAWLTDWSWALRGPAWADAALWGFRLILDGWQNPEQAATWARSIPAFAQADREAVVVLTEAEARAWEHMQEHGMTELEETIKAARAWADYWASP